MKAAIYKGIKQLACEERPKPGIVVGGDAIIRVVRACVCGSDLWFYRDGGKPVDSQAGHEAIGVVEAVGEDVTIVKPGDFVIVPFPYSCGKCPVCKAGFESSCPHGGYFGDEDGMGCQAEYLRVPEAEGTLVVVPGDAKTFSDEMLASLLTLSDVMATGYHAAASAEVKPGDTAVVFGDGAVGLCAVLSAKLMGATRIISMSRHTDRQEIAKKFGATDFVEERGDEAVAKVLEMTDGYGADAVLECVGSALSNDTAMKVARAGAIVGRVGLPHDVAMSVYAVARPRCVLMTCGACSRRCWTATSIPVSYTLASTHWMISRKRMPLWTNAVPSSRCCGSAKSDFVVPNDI